MDLNEDHNIELLAEMLGTAIEAQQKNFRFR